MKILSIDQLTSPASFDQIQSSEDILFIDVNCQGTNISTAAIINLEDTNAFSKIIIMAHWQGASAFCLKLPIFVLSAEIFPKIEIYTDTANSIEVFIDPSCSPNKFLDGTTNKTFNYSKGLNCTIMSYGWGVL